MSAFDWRTLPGGRARFAGSIRGWDEAGHETFALEIGEKEQFGELKNFFAENGDDFGVVVVSFGYRDRIRVGLPIDCESASVKRLSPISLDRLKQRIVELVEAGLAQDPPSFLKQYPSSRFTGEIVFAPNWHLALLDDSEALS